MLLVSKFVFFGKFSNIKMPIEFAVPLSNLHGLSSKSGGALSQERILYQASVSSAAYNYRLSIDSDTVQMAVKANFCLRMSLARSRWKVSELHRTCSAPSGCVCVSLDEGRHLLLHIIIITRNALRLIIILSFTRQAAAPNWRFIYWHHIQFCFMVPVVVVLFLDKTIFINN